MDRKDRVRILKRAIIFTVIFLILLPTVLSVVLFIRTDRLTKELSAARESLGQADDRIVSLQGELQTLSAENASLSDRLDQNRKEILQMLETEEEEETEAPVSSTWPRRVYLTFDDGPSGHTGDILDILNSYGVKGNFFVCATRNEDYWHYYRDILDQGHMLGLHSYSHDYDEIYASQEAFENDVLFDRTNGYVATYYRFPGGSSNLHSRISLNACTDWLDSQGLIYYDWNLSSQGATNPMQSVESILYNATYGCEEFEDVMILMHDLGNKDSTVEALPKIIEFYQERGAVISVIDENAPLIRHDR